MESRRKSGRRPLAYVAHFDDFINSSGDGFVDGAAEHLTDINPQMKDALSTIMLQVADILRDLREAEETKNTELAKILRGNLAYLQDTVVDFVTDIIEGVQKEATDADLDEFADQLIDDVAHMATMASSAMMDKNSREMQRCRSLTAGTADPDLASSKACRVLWDTKPNGVLPGCMQPNRAAPGCNGLSTGIFGKKKRPECDWGVPECKNKTFGQCERIQDKADHCYRAPFAPPPMCAAAKSQYPDGYIKDRRVHAREIYKLCGNEPDFKAAMKRWKEMRFGHKSLRARVRQAALSSTTDTRDLYDDCVNDKAYSNCAARIGRKVGSMLLRKAIRMGTAGIL